MIRRMTRAACVRLSLSPLPAVLLIACTAARTRHSPRRPRTGRRPASRSPRRSSPTSNCALGDDLPARRPHAGDRKGRAAAARVGATARRSDGRGTITVEQRRAGRADGRRARARLRAATSASISAIRRRGAGGKGVGAGARHAGAAARRRALDDIEVIFRATPFVEGNGHYSGRIAFSPDGKYLFFTNGERQKFTPRRTRRRRSARSCA